MGFNSIGMSYSYIYNVYNMYIIVLYSVSRKLKYRFILLLHARQYAAQNVYKLSRHIVPLCNVYTIQVGR